MLLKSIQTIIGINQIDEDTLRFMWIIGILMKERLLIGQLFGIQCHWEISDLQWKKQS